MSKHDKSTRSREYRDHSRDRDRSRDRGDRYDRYDRYERSDRDRDTRRRSRRHRSPSYDSYSDSDSDDSDSSREPSPRRPSRRHTTAHSDGEDRGYRSRGREHRRREREYHSEESPSRERSGKAGVVEDLLAAVGLIQNKHKDSRGRDRSGGGPEERKKNTREALQAALTAAAMEAFRTRKEGKLTPQRLMQIAGAAIAAGGLDVLVDKSGGDGGSLKTVIESVVGGLATGKTMGRNIKHKRDGSVGDKVGSGVVGMAAKHLLSRSLSQGPRRSKTTKY